MRGRKPASTPLGDVVDLPTAATRVPDCPKYLKGRSRECWDLVTRELVGRNIYDTDIRDTVASYCVQMARFLDAEDEIAERGFIVKSRRNKTEMFNIRLAVSDRAFDRMSKLAAELGLTPVSRKRVARVRGTSSAPASKFLKKA